MDAEFDYGYGSAKAEIDEFGMDDDMKEVFEIYTEDPKDFLNIVPGTLKGMYPEWTKGYMQYCREYMKLNAQKNHYNSMDTIAAGIVDSLSMFPIHTVT